MFAARHVLFLGALAAASAVLDTSQALAYDPQSKPADNSGRRLALVVPAMPHPGINSSKGLSTTAASTSRQTGVGAGSTVKHRLQPQPTVLTSHYRLSPQAQAVVDSGFTMLRLVCNQAWTRICDAAVWISILLRQPEQPPRLTPANPLVQNGLSTLPNVSQALMKPIADPGKCTQLVFTCEHRLRTVVGR